MRRIALASLLLLPLGGCLLLGGSNDDGGACVPDVEGTEDPAELDPECATCVERSCDGGNDCSAQCEDYYACTCDCEPDDTACFGQCADEKSASCASCEEDGADAFFACIEDECGDVCFGGGSGADPTTGDPTTGNPPDDSAGGACQTLQSTCCPQLTGFDRELCDDAEGEVSCQLWLDVFTEEGSC